jgi:DNA-binding MarR family transcriptional regulator
MAHDTDELLAKVRAIRDGTDLDLLLFSYRHPRALLTVEHLAAVLGQARERVKVSLDALIGAGLIEPLQDPTRETHIFVFRSSGQDAVTMLLQIASSRSGRLALLAALRQRATTTPHKRKA